MPTSFAGFAADAERLVASVAAKDDLPPHLEELRRVLDQILASARLPSDPSPTPTHTLHGRGGELALPCFSPLSLGRGAGGEGLCGGPASGWGDGEPRW